MNDQALDFSSTSGRRESWRALQLAGLLLCFGASAANADPQVVAASGAEDPLLIQSRQLVAEFERRLKTQLQAAMQAGGPVQAITVCRDVAPRIAADLSRQSGASIGRVSDRFRNPLNVPESWQVDVLAGFATKPRDGDVVAEFFEEKAGNTRYMKAIPTQPICLTCHGSSLSPAVDAALESDYPHDRAVGYELGQLRGAFSVIWPAQ